MSLLNWFFAIFAFLYLLDCLLITPFALSLHAEETQMPLFSEVGFMAKCGLEQYGNNWFYYQGVGVILLMYYVMWGLYTHFKPCAYVFIATGCATILFFAIIPNISQLISAENWPLVQAKLGGLLDKVKFW